MRKNFKKVVVMSMATSIVASNLGGIGVHMQLIIK